MLEGYKTTPADRMVGANIKRHRVEKGVSKEKISEQLGCSGEYLNSVEQGEVRLGVHFFYDLAMLFDCRISDFFNMIPHFLRQNAVSETTEQRS